jgi:hypothetical protein
MANVPATLPANWAIFVDDVALGADPVSSAKALGYPDPRATAAALLRMPVVRKALVAASEARLVSTAVPLALAVVESILRDEKASPAVRGKMAIAVLDRAREKEDKTAPGAKAIGDMTVAELEAHVRQLQDTKARALDMRDVTPGHTLADSGEPDIS